MSRAILLTGTSEREPAPSRLVAGPLSADLDRGQLRNIRWRGVEILRAVSFLVRTPGWGTPAPEISGLVVESPGERFRVAYEAVYANAGQRLRARLSFKASAEGRLNAEVRLTQLTAFTTKAAPGACRRGSSRRENRRSRRRLARRPHRRTLHARNSGQGGS